MNILKKRTHRTKRLDMFDHVEGSVPVSWLLSKALWNQMNRNYDLCRSNQIKERNIQPLQFLQNTPLKRQGSDDVVWIQLTALKKEREKSIVTTKITTTVRLHLKKGWDQGPAGGKRAWEPVVIDEYVSEGWHGRPLSKNRARQLVWVGRASREKEISVHSLTRKQQCLSVSKRKRRKKRKGNHYSSVTEVRVVHSEGSVPAMLLE